MPVADVADVLNQPRDCSQGSFVRKLPRQVKGQLGTPGWKQVKMGEGCLGSVSRVRGDMGKEELMRPCPALWAPEASSSSLPPAPTGLRDPGHLPSLGHRSSPPSQPHPSEHTVGLRFLQIEPLALRGLSCRLFSLTRQPAHFPLLASHPEPCACFPAHPALCGIWVEHGSPRLLPHPYRNPDSPAAC